MDEQEKRKKLEELEKTLAEELDQNVKTLGGPATTGNTNDVGRVIRGQASTDSSVTVTGGDEKADDEVSLDDIDQILNEVDPTFQKSLDDLANNIRTVEKNIQIDSILVDAEDSGDASIRIEQGSTDFSVAESKKEKKSILRHAIEVPVKMMNGIFTTIQKLRDEGVKQVVLAVRKNIPEWIEKFKLVLSQLVGLVSQQFHIFTKLKTSAKSFLLLFFISLIGLGLYLKLVLSGDFLGDEKQPAFLASFIPVADRIVEFSDDEPMEDFDNPVRNPDYTVIIKKVVSNVQRSKQSGLKPMVAFQVYLEASSQEAAIEIKNREREVSDYLARVAEGLEYDEWVTEDGKNRFRTLARRRINEVLNNGRVQKIYFKTVFYKP